MRYLLATLAFALAALASTSGAQVDHATINRILDEAPEPQRDYRRRQRTSPIASAAA